jgi:hypothetical protein
MSNKYNYKEIIDSYLSGLTYVQLVDLYGCCESTIRYILNKNKIQRRTQSESRRSKRLSFLTKDHHEILDGLLLGDGGIYKYNRPTPFFQMCNTQLDFIENVKFHLPFKFTERVEKGGKKLMFDRTCDCKTMYRIRSYVDNSLEEIRIKWYEDKIKVVPQDLMLTPLVCKYWFYSDGYSSYHKNKNCVSLGLCTNSFSYKECEFLIQKLKDIGFEFKIQIASVSSSGFYLSTRIKSSINGFLDYCKQDGILQCFEYKWKYHTGKNLK